LHDQTLPVLIANWIHVEDGRIARIRMPIEIVAS
jgi:hypothetical protein